MSYSQVLEQQASMYRFVESGRGLARMAVSVTTPLGVDEREARRGLLAGVMHMLKVGDPYYWDAVTCDLVEGTASGMPEMTLKPDDLITPFGFCWFARPLRLTTPGWVGRDLPMTGYAWGEAFGQGVLIMPFVPSPEHPAGAPSQVIMWRFGDTFATLAENVEELSRMGPPGADPPEDAAVRRVEQVRYVAACTAFMNQRILVRQSERPVRATRRRLERERWEHKPTIEVVKLRRAKQDGREREHGEPVEWSCRWIVSGHWRQQFYPSTGENRPIFILPHVKGPENAPLKPKAERVFAVAR